MFADVSKVLLFIFKYQTLEIEGDISFETLEARYRAMQRRVSRRQDFSFAPIRKPQTNLNQCILSVIAHNDLCIISCLKDTIGLDLYITTSGHEHPGGGFAKPNVTVTSDLDLGNINPLRQSTNNNTVHKHNS